MKFGTHIHGSQRMTLTNFGHFLTLLSSFVVGQSKILFQAEISKQLLDRMEHNFFQIFLWPPDNESY